MTDADVVLFVNRTARTYALVVLGPLAVAFLVAAVRTNSTASAVSAGILTVVLTTLAVRSVRRLTLSANNREVVVRSILRTRRLPRSSVSSWTIEYRSNVAYRRTQHVLVAQLTNGMREDLGRVGIWSEQPDVIEQLCWKLNQTQRA